MHILKGMPICVLHFWSLELACAFPVHSTPAGPGIKTLSCKTFVCSHQSIKICMYTCTKLTSEGVGGGIHIISRSWMSIRRPREMTSITRPHDKRRRRRGVQVCCVQHFSDWCHTRKVMMVSRRFIYAPRKYCSKIGFIIFALLLLSVLASGSYNLVATFVSQIYKSINLTIYANFHHSHLRNLKLNKQSVSNNFLTHFRYICIYENWSCIVCWTEKKNR